MRRKFIIIVNSAMALVLLIALSMRLVSSGPLMRNQPTAPVVARGSGETFVVTSIADSGPGTLRQALQDAQSGDSITFDPSVFPPTAPVTISLASGLPDIHQGNLTIDASNVGVILDGNNMGSSTETLLLDDISLTFDGGPNLLANGDFTAGLGHWRPWSWDEGPGMTRGLNSSDFHSPPSSYAWSTVAHAGGGHTVYDTTNTSASFDSDPYYLGSTVWISVTGASTAELRCWYKFGPVHVALLALFQDGHVEQICDWRLDSAETWTEAIASQVVPANAVGVALELRYSHSEYGTSGFSIWSNGNTIRGLQIIDFPSTGIGLSGDAQNNTIGGDRGIGTGPLGQGNLISGNRNFGVGLWGAGTSFNTIQGNIIGTNLSGATEWGGRRDGIHSNGANHNLVLDNLISGYETGVYVCCETEGYNTVRGNYIGTDASGGAGVGNRGAGVALDRSGHNVATANVIAYNGGSGIAVYAADAVYNRITQNSIHDNGGPGIGLWTGGNTRLAAPAIYDFDLSAGTITGVACASCTIEIFSDSDDEGAIYEGHTTTDSAGFFVLNKGAPFVGPHLTATATDADSNTSRFSAPTSGTRRTVIPQEDNNQPLTQFRSKRSVELENNYIGSEFDKMWPPYDYNYDLNIITDLGIKRAELILQELEAPVDWSIPEYYIPPEFDNYISTLSLHDITVSYRLIFWDKANHPQGWEGISSRFKTEEDIQRYLDYVRFIVRHFKGPVQYFKIWNEPDNCGYPYQCVAVTDMINLIRRAVPVIREEYPEAKIVAPSNVIFYAPDYLQRMIKSDIMPLVDVVCWQTMPDYGPSDEEWRNFYSNYPSLVQQIKDTASAHGFSGEYWATPLTWWYPRHPKSSVHYPDSAFVVAKDYTRSIVMQLGMGVSIRGLTTNFERRITWPAISNLCTVMAGATADSLPVAIEGAAADIKQYGFTVQNGSHMVILWRDVEPVANDPGVPVTITLAGFAGQWATSVNVLYGFEQRLITSNEGGNLVIHNLLVKDYPIILRIASTPVGILTEGLKGPTIYKLGNNYPNPFNLETTIHYQLPKQTHVSINIYNIKGQLVVSLVDEKLEAGYYSVQWVGRSNSGIAVASGVYFYRMKAGSFIQTRNMVLLQ